MSSYVSPQFKYMIFHIFIAEKEIGDHFIEIRYIIFSFSTTLIFKKVIKGKFYIIIILSYLHVFFGWAVEYLLAAIAENDIKHFILFSDESISIYDQKRALCVVQVSGSEISITFLFDALLTYTVQNDILKSAFKLKYNQLFALCSFVVILQNNHFSRRWM